MSVLNFLKLDGTQTSKFQLNATGTGVVLKNNAGNLEARNAADNADATITGSEFLASGDIGLVINSDAVGAAGDWSISVARPNTGMTANWTLTLPTTAGSPNQVLQTDGTGVTTWVDTASGATDITDTTNLAFGSSSTTTMFTLPANAVILSVICVVDSAFDGTPSASVGIAGNTSKYMGSGDLNLNIAAGWTVSPNIAPDASSEALIITYSAGGATAGAARFLVNYSVAS